MRSVKLWCSPIAMKANIALAIGFVFPFLIYIPYGDYFEVTSYTVVASSILSVFGTALISWFILSWLIKSDVLGQSYVLFWFIVTGNILAILNVAKHTYDMFYPSILTDSSVEAIMGNIGTKKHFAEILVFSMLQNAKTLLLIGLISLSLKSCLYVGKKLFKKLRC